MNFEILSLHQNVVLNFVNELTGQFTLYMI
jgi:hypothetical protein